MANHKRVARLMRQAGIEGVYRRRRSGCTRRDPDAVPSDDLVNRQFNPDRPLRSDPYTEHPTREGDRKSTRLNSSHTDISRMPSSA